MESLRYTTKCWVSMPFASDRPGIPMRRATTFAAGAALLLAGGIHAALAADLYVICNPGVTLQNTEIRNMFLGEKGFAGAIRLAPADNDSAQALFLDKVMHLNADKYAALWTRKSFLSGISPPPAQGSDAQAIAYVRKTSGGCSYVTSAPGSDVSVVARF